MFTPEKVDEFYTFLKDKRYVENDPETIIIISPNHFNQRSTTHQTICCIPLSGGIEGGCEVYFQNKKYQLTPFPNIDCDENIFYPFGNVVVTDEHGIGEHLSRITKHFPEVKQVIPLILPTHLPPFVRGAAKQPRSLVRRNSEAEGFLDENNIPLTPFTKGGMVIASVDFSHYLSETIARTNDEVSIAILQN
ncbi:MAG: hypothetical protein LBI53_04215 [Candidatus Peribacteria bacterium]|jgi:hypothetical protein|nr:hypothetical protein [Candidatus Peribacteria bacterium]